MSTHECKYESSISTMQTDLAETKTDIKWLVKDSKRRNGIMEEHVKESDSFRDQVGKNTGFRKATHKLAWALIIGSLYTLCRAMWVSYLAN